MTVGRAARLAAVFVMFLAAALVPTVRGRELLAAGVPWVAGDIALAAGGDASGVFVLRPSDLAVKDFLDLSGPCPGGPQRARFSPDGTKLYAACGTKIVVIDALAPALLVLETVNLTACFGPGGEASDLEFDADGNWYATAGESPVSFCKFSPTNQLLQAGFAGNVTAQFVTYSCGNSTSGGRLIYTDISTISAVPLPSGAPIAPFAAPSGSAGGLLSLLSGNLLVGGDNSYYELTPGGVVVNEFVPTGGDLNVVATVAPESYDTTAKFVYVVVLFADAEFTGFTSRVYKLNATGLGVVATSPSLAAIAKSASASNATRATLCPKAAPPGVPCTAGPCCNATTKVLVSNGTACVWDVPSGSGTGSLFALPANVSSGQRKSCKRAEKACGASSTLPTCGGTCQSGVCVLAPPANGGGAVASTKKKHKKKKGKSKSCCALASASSGGGLSVQRTHRKHKDDDDDDDDNDNDASRGCFCIARDSAKKWG